MCVIASQHLTIVENGVQPHEIALFLLLETLNRIEKIRIKISAELIGLIILKMIGILSLSIIIKTEGEFKSDLVQNGLTFFI